MGWGRFFRRQRWDAERAAEMESYIEMETADNVARGMDETEARRAARRKFGNPAHVREEIYRMNSIAWVETFARDVLYGLRALRKSPGFTAVAVVSLALGIGANTAIFSLVHTLMLRGIPVARPDEVVQVAIVDKRLTLRARARSWSGSLSYPIIDQIREGNHVFAGMFAWDGSSPGDIRLDSPQERVNVERVGGAYFEVLGVQPVLGRVFTAAEDDPAAPPAAVISYSYWQRRFNADPSVLGRTLQYRDRLLTIVGVAAPRFAGLSVDAPADLFLPVASITPVSRLRGPRAHGTWSPRLVARLRPGLSREQALPALNVLFSQIIQNEDQLFRARDTEHRVTESQHHDFVARELTLLPGGRGISGLRRQYSEPLIILMTVVGLVLLIACANIANLLLVRAGARRREIAIRLAIGADRKRLLMQLLTESLLLATMGAGAGLLFAIWAGRTLVTMVIGNATSSLEFHIDQPTLLFTAGVSALTAILFGLGPAFRATRLNLNPALKNDSAAPQARFRIPVAKILVVSQVTLSLVLVMGAVLFVTTLQKLVGQDIGFQRDSVLIAGIDLDEKVVKREQLLPAFNAILERIGGLPGVQSATMSSYALFGGGTWSEQAYLEGRYLNTDIQWVAANYFETLRTPLVMGRVFTPHDDSSAPRVAIVNETFARKLFPDGPAIGRRFGWNPNGAADIEVIGVVKNTKWSNLRQAAPPFVYLNLAQPLTSPYPESGVPRSMVLNVRAAGDPAHLMEPVRREARSVNASIGLMTTQDDLVDSTLRQEKLLAKISGFFGAIGLLLAAVGLFGLMSYTVSRRTNEIGLRMALGARPADLVRMVMGESLVLVATGLVAGTLLAWAATQLIERFLFGVARTDPWATALAVTILAAVALVAAAVPALRAARVDPMIALRHD